MMLRRCGLLAAGFAAAVAQGPAGAADLGRVISSTAVVAPVALPQTRCTETLQPVAPATSGGGAVLGAIVGGALGNAIGAGTGRAAATGLGVVAGAVLGNQAEAAQAPPAQATVRQCHTTTATESRVVGYDVVYEFNGRRYRARLAQDPGDTVALDAHAAPLAGTLPLAAPAPAGEVAAAAPLVTVAPYDAPSVVYPPSVVGPAVVLAPPVWVPFHRHWR